MSRVQFRQVPEEGVNLFGVEAETSALVSKAEADRAKLSADEAELSRLAAEVAKIGAETAEVGAGIAGETAGAAAGAAAGATQGAIAGATQGALAGQTFVAQAEAQVARAMAAADTVTAAIANAAIQASTLAALIIAMAASPNETLGVVYDLNADEGVYRKLNGSLVRVSDTLRQIEERTGAYAVLGVSPPLLLFGAKNSNGEQVEIGRFHPDETFEVRSIRAQTIAVEQTPWVSFEAYAAIGVDPGATIVVDPDGNIEGYIPKSLSEGGGLAPSGLRGDDIRNFSPDIDITGATDMSVEVRAVHDAAFAAGVRYVYVPGPILCPTAELLGNVIWIGPGKFVGNRRRVVPEHAGTAPICNNLYPNSHYPQFLARLAAASPQAPVRVVVTGDSITEWRSTVSGVDWAIPSIMAEFRRQFGSQYAKMRIVDRGVGGMSWRRMALENMVGKPVKVWAEPDTSVSILTRLQEAAGDLYVIWLGQNDQLGTGLSLSSLRATVAAIRAFPGNPEIIMVLTAFRASMAGVNGSQIEQATYDEVAGGMRSYCEQNNIGYVDMPRWFAINRDGEDTVETIPEVVQENAVVTLPFTAPEESVDWGIELTTSANGGAAFWANGTLAVNLSNRPGNVLFIDRDTATGNIAWAVDAGTGFVSVARTVTDIPAIVAGNLFLSISVRGGNLVITSGEPITAGALAVSAAIERSGGYSVPTFSFVGGGTPSVTIARRAIANPGLYMPQQIDLDVLGESRFGGNASAHYSSYGSLFMRTCLAATRFAP